MIEYMAPVQVRDAARDKVLPRIFCFSFQFVRLLLLATTTTTCSCSPGRLTKMLSSKKVSLILILHIMRLNSIINALSQKCNHKIKCGVSPENCAKTSSGRLVTSALRLATISTKHAMLSVVNLYIFRIHRCHHRPSSTTYSSFA